MRSCGSGGRSAESGDKLRQWLLAGAQSDQGAIADDAYFESLRNQIIGDETMDLTPQDLWTLRNIAVRAINETHEVLAAAARRAKHDRARPQPHQPNLEPPPAPAPTPQASPKLAFTLKEASAALSVSKSTVYRLISEGQLPALRIGGRRLVEVAEIEAFLETKRRASGR